MMTAVSGSSSASKNVFSSPGTWSDTVARMGRRRPRSRRFLLIVAFGGKRSGLMRSAGDFRGQPDRSAIVSRNTGWNLGQGYHCPRGRRPAAPP